MKRGIRGILAVACAMALYSLSPGNAMASEAEWEQLMQEVRQRHGQGKYEDAVPFARRSVELAEATFGKEHGAVAASLLWLAELYQSQGKYAHAEPLYKRSLAIREKAFGPEHPSVASSLNDLAELYRAQGQYAQAEPLYKRSLAIHEKASGAEHPSIATSLNNLAVLYQSQGKYAAAEPFYQRSLAIMEKANGAEHPRVATSLNNLAMLYQSQSKYAAAEPLLKRSLTIYEKALGTDHPDVALSLNNLAELYRSHGKYAAAESLYKRSLEIWEKALGAEHPSLAMSLSNLGVLYESQGLYAQAEPLYQRSLAIYEKSLGADHPSLANSLNNLAGVYLSQGKYAAAESLCQRSLTIREKALGAEHPDVAASLNNLAWLYYTQGLYAQAEPLYQRSLAIMEKSLGADHPSLANSVNNLALLYFDQGQYAAALTPIRRASAIYRSRIVKAGADDSASLEAGKNRAAFLFHLSLLARNPDKETPTRIADEALQVAQLEQSTGTAAAVAKMAARFASGDDALATLVKRRQDAAERMKRDEARIVTTVSQPPDKRNVSAEQTLRDQIAAAQKDIAALDAELDKRFPDYQALTRPEPLTATAVQRLLRPGEAMLLYVFGENIDGEHAFVWVVTPGSAHFQSLDVSPKALAKTIGEVRASMDFDSATQQPVPARIDVLHGLYKQLFAPLEPHLAGAKHLLVVPSGAVQSLPFSMLVASDPGTKVSDTRAADWLANRYAFSVLPSVGSLRAFRQFAKTPPKDPSPFAGFGDPAIGEAAGATRGKRIDIAGVFRNLVAQKSGPARASMFEIADVESIRRAPALPETAGELTAMARVLKGGPEHIWLRQQATETRVKQTDLSRYRMLAFATHGVMSGEVKGIGEPGLILTPPRTGTREDDGYMAASEVAQLKLNADWVLLSACNTAAADGTPGAEGLSGLAKAFFYAGARSLLVSHWPVASEATVPLTTAMLAEYEKNPAQGKAEAHRKAMLSLMNTPDHPEWSHPLFWAPFVVVGEGGR